MRIIGKLQSCFLIVVTFLLIHCNAQPNQSAEHKKNCDEGRPVGGAFENRDYLYRGLPERLSANDTSPGWGQNGQKLLITGTIYKPDGKTPAPDVLLYYYHTNTAGKYVHKPGEQRSMPPNSNGQTHGYIRGWIKTNKSGSYSIYTVRPGTYPNRDEPAHIHLTIKEPRIDCPYYIDEFVFDDDVLLTPPKRKKLENRGGSGILRVLSNGNLQIAEHDIILGLNIPGYPEIEKKAVESGLHIGEEQPSFTPFHVFGADKGSRACPVCKYGRYYGILYFVGNHPNWEEIKKWLTYLEQMSASRPNELKVYLIYANSANYSTHIRQTELENIGIQLRIKRIALTFIPSFNDAESEITLSKINPNVDNTFIVFKQRVIVGKFINLNPRTGSFEKLSSILKAKKSLFFDL